MIMNLQDISFRIRFCFALAGIFMIFTSTCIAEDLSFSKGSWRLAVDRESGALRTLQWNGEIISSNPSGAPLFNWGPQWSVDRPDFKKKLISHSWDGKSGALVLHMKQGDWLVAETVTLGFHGDPDLLAIDLRLIYSPLNKTAEPAKFDRVTLSMPIAKTGRYLLPGKREFLNHDGAGLLSALKNGEERRSAWGIPPLLIESNPALTLIFMPEFRRDIAGSSFKIDGDRAIVRQESRACGWAYPDEPQNIGPFYLGVVDGNLEQAFTKGVWKVFDSIDLKAVADTPDWFRDAVLYSFQPGGTIGSGWKDLGGFVPAREELLPRLRQLGFDTLWILPVEEGHIYWPRDYYKLQERLGSESDLKELVEAAHGYGMKVLFDSVPHGGTPESGKLRGNHPGELIFDENGDAYRYWCFDFGNPDWQKYMAGVADYYMKKYQIDGYRIDAVIGNHYYNWRKKDFPSLAKLPKNVPEDWWRSALTQNGGKLPPLPYERASLGCRQGGLEMLKAIKGAVKRNRPDGVILAEVDHAPYMQDGDAIYNFPLALTLSETATRMPSAEWAASLARWLDELNFANPRGTRWLQYFGSHDHLSPFGWVGVNKVKALMAVAMMLEGIPMVYHDQDVGIGVWLAKLIAIRRALPELRRGDGRYSTAGPGVFSAVRRYEGLSSVALINLSPDTARAELKEAIAVARPGTGRVAVWTPDASTPIAVGTAESLKSLSVELKPWAYEVLAFRPEGSPSPFPREEAAVAPQPVKTDGAVAVTEQEESIDISAPAYLLSIGKSDGRLLRFSDRSGGELLEGSGFIVDPSFTFDQSPIRPAATEVKVENNGSGVTVTVKTVLPSGSTVGLSYRCGKDAVTLDASLEDAGAAPRAGIAFAAKNVTRWQVSSAEGLLDDFFTVRHAKGTPSQTMPEGILYYRLSGTPVMWQAETNPLAFEKPSILAFSNEHGVEFSVCDPLSGGLRNAMVLDKLGGKPGWHTAFFWQDVQPYPQRNNADGKETKCFSIVIRPTAAPLTDQGGSEWTGVGKVKLRNISSGWIVENDHYSVDLLRCGGVMRSLRSKSSKQEVLKNNQVYTNRGFRRKWGEKNMLATSSNDGETGVGIWREGERLHMRFSYSMRGPNRRWLLDPMVWAETEYVFDGSPSIKIRWSITSIGKPHDSPAFLAWEIASENWMSSVFQKGGKQIAAGFSVKTAELGDAVRPDAVRFFGRDRKTMLRLSDIRYPADAPAQNVALQDSVFFIASLDGAAEKIEPGKTYETSLVLTVGE